MNQDKYKQFSQLTRERKECNICRRMDKNNVHLFNASSLMELDCDTIGQWTMWNGNLDAEYMIVGQDWGTKDYLEKFRQTQKNENYPCELDSITNRNLAECVKQINSEWDILSLDDIQNNERYPLYFTNEILCYKDDKLMNASIPTSCYYNCSNKFLVRQVEIVEPKVIVLLGMNTFNGFVNVTKTGGLENSGKISGNFSELIANVLDEKLILNYRTSTGKVIRIFPMWHPGGLGLRNAKTADTKKNGDRGMSGLDILKEQWRILDNITK